LQLCKYIIKRRIVSEKIYTAFLTIPIIGKERKEKMNHFESLRLAVLTSFLVAFLAIQSLSFFLPSFSLYIFGDEKKVYL